MIVSWQRLVLGNDTCPRCGSTEAELAKALAQLKKALAPKGIDVVLKKTELSLEEFKKDPLRSNSIFFDGIRLEDLVGAATGRNECCGVCGDTECRTVEIGAEVHETVSAELIVKAGMIAASQNRCIKK